MAARVRSDRERVMWLELLDGIPCRVGHGRWSRFSEDVCRMERGARALGSNRDREVVDGIFMFTR